MNIILILLVSVGCILPFEAHCLPWLTTKGKDIVDEEGNRVIFRGVNLGGWLVEEMWMLPFVKESIDHVTLWNTIEKRFGTAKMIHMRAVFRETWIQKRDFERIADAGLNCVRIPFLASLTEETGGFEILDRAIEECRKQGLYVILDMHGTFGSQSKEDHTGEVGRNQLFKDPEMVKKTANAWVQIASRYKGSPVVAAYDLMNEPMGAEGRKELHQVHNVLYQAIRKVDTRHMIIIEDGYKGIETIPEVKKMGWKNVVLSTHTYGSKAETEEDFIKNFEAHLEKASLVQNKGNLPYYLGEFNIKPSFNVNDLLTKCITLAQQRNQSWSTWTYKLAGRCPRSHSWGLYGTPKKLKKIDSFNDSEEKILKKIKKLGTENFIKNKGLFEVFRKTVVK